jgi:hypothetical protein
MLSAHPPKQRRAPIAAQRILGELIKLLPYAPTFPHEFNIVVFQGEAIHLAQQVCHAIKQHNATEHERREQRWQEQVVQAKKPGGVVTLPDYEINIIPWVLKYRLIDPPRNPRDMNQSEGYTPRCTLYADYPKGRQSKVGKMDELIAKLFPKKIIEPTQPKQDPFETWLADAPVAHEDATEKNLPIEPQSTDVPSAPVKKASYTREELIAKGWTFDDQGKPIPPKRA